MRLSERRSEAAAAALAFVIIVFVAIWMVAPRFDADAPAVIDDWWAVNTAPAAFDQLKSLSYDPDAFLDGSRYRPAYTGVWNELQWHTLGAPGNMTGPNFWNILRLLLFFGGLTALTLVFLRGLLDDDRVTGWRLGLLANVPGALILATPGAILTFARFGPQEPIVFGAVTIGLLLMVLGLRRVLVGDGGTARSRIATAAALVAGYVIFLFGAYTKEASVTLLAAAPFVLLYLDSRWRSEGVITRRLWTSKAVWAFSLAIALPLLQIGLQVKSRAGRETLYGEAPPPSGLGGWLERIGDSIDGGVASMPALIPTRAWQVVIVAVPFLVAATMVWRRRVDWASIGLLVLALAIWTFQGLSGAWDSRYYIPSLALIAIAALIGTPLSSRRWAPLVAVAAALVFAMTASARHHEVEGYAGELKRNESAIALTAAMRPESCPVYIADMNLEYAEAWPTLLALRDDVSGPCDTGFEAILIRGPGYGAANESIDFVCEKPGWKKITASYGIIVSGCERLRSGRPDDENLYGQYIGDILRWNRLTPGVTLRERLNTPALGPFCRAEVCAKPFEAIRTTR